MKTGEANVWRFSDSVHTHDVDNHNESSQIRHTSICLINHILPAAHTTCINMAHSASSRVTIICKPRPESRNACVNIARDAALRGGARTAFCRAPQSRTTHPLLSSRPPLIKRAILPHQRILSRGYNLPRHHDLSVDLSAREAGTHRG